MLIPQITTLRTEDFPSEKDWISKLLFPINQFLTNTISSVNGNITLGDNIPCQTQSLMFVYGSASDFPKTFKWVYTSKPVEIRVCSAIEDSNPIAVVPIWSFSNNIVSISDFVKLTTTGVSALASGSLYNIVLRGQP